MSEPGKIGDGNDVPRKQTPVRGYDEVVSDDELVDAAAGALGAAVSVVLVLVSFAVSFVVVSVLDDDVSEARDEPDRESVLYQPDPLKTMPAGWKMRRIFAPQLGQVVKGESENF